MKNWIFNIRTDIFGLLMPVWIVLCVTFFLPDAIINQEFSIWMWVVFVLGIDVSHVWSTLFRTYLDKEERSKHHFILSAAPILAFTFTFSISFFSPFWFWRILAYLALFHFIKQQYGFMMLYKAKAKDFSPRKWFTDKQVIYLAMLFPVLFWHFSPNRVFSWFISGDFFPIHSLYLPSALFWNIMSVIYIVIILTWLVIELKREIKSWGKILWVVTTACNWYIGIVYFNSDLVFTLTNVVAHGIPYVILIIQYEHKKSIVRKKPKKIAVISTYIVLGVLFLGMLEEYGWDIFMYGEHKSFYESFLPHFGPILEHPAAVAFGLALLSLPQVTHYILDGFIWKSNNKNPYVKTMLSK